MPFYEEDYYKILFQFSTDAIFIIDLNGRLLECSNKAAEILGYSIDDMRTLYVYDWDIFHSKEEALEHIRNTPNTSINFETKHKRKDGSIYYAEITAVKINTKEKDFIYASVRDISFKKEIESKLTEANKKLSAIALNIPGVIYTFQLWEDGRSCFPYSSEHMYDIYGVLPSDVQEDATKVFNVLHPDDLEYITQTIETSKKELSIWETEYRVIHPIKGIIKVKGLAQPEQQSDGSILWHGYIYDITEKSKQTELIKEKNELIEKAQLKYKLIFEESFDGIVLIDPITQKFIEFNATAHNMYGYDRDEFSHLRVADLEVIQNEEKIKFVQQQILENGWDRFETVHKEKDGSFKNIIVNIRTITIDNSILIYANFHDITFAEQQEKLILTQKKEYESIFNYSQDPIGIIDMDSRFITLNDAYIHMLGFSKEELIGKQCIELSIPEDIPRVIPMFQELKERGFIQNFEKSCYKKNGEIIDVSLSLVVLPDNERILINAKDLTVKKKLFNELMIAKINAENANAAQSKFLANMSHEIRTPMNGILGFSKILKDSLTNPVDVDHANMIETSAKMLLEIINDILDISKIQSGNMELDKQNFDLYDALVHTIRLYQVQAFEKNISFEIDIDETLKDLKIFSDAIKLKQVISNLLNNAIKFTPQYGMILFSSKVVETDKTSKVRFSVKDNGIGISQDRQIIIFEPFRQENESTTREFGGTGLGLSICKEIVNMFGGDLLLMSQKDQGSEFYFEITFPFGEEVVSKQIVIDEKNSLIGKVLVAEDVEINQKLFKVLLAQKGFDSVFANNGLELVKIFKNQCDEFDMVFVDINMPIMDGLEALPELQTIKKQNQMSNPPIIALTANAIDGDKERYLELGFDAYLSKPIDAQVLWDILSKFGRKYEELK